MRALTNKNFLLLLLFLILSLFMTYPMVTYLGSGIPGWEGDNLFYIRQLWWVKHSLVDLQTSPFFDPFAYYPVGYQVANGELTPANTILFLPITAIWGPVVSYNVILIFSFFASAVGAYLWVWHLTSCCSAGLVAGVIFAFLPYRFAHLPGHMELMSTQWIPLALFALERFIASRQVRWAIASGVSIALIALSSWYYAYSALLLLPVYVLLRTCPWRTHWTERGWWQGLLIIGLVAFVLVIPFAIPYRQMAERGYLSRTVAQTDAWSLNPYDFFTPNLSHPVWGGHLGELFPKQAGQWVERGVSLGYVAIVLSIIGLRKSKEASWVKAVVLLWALSYLIALGPTLHFHDQQVRLFSWPVPLPAYALYAWMPFTSSMRVMTRFGLWTGLMTSALAGWGANITIDWLTRRSPKLSAVRYIAFAVVVFLILFESYGMVYHKFRLSPRSVDLWLSQLEKPTVIIELPLHQAERPIQDYYATVHQQATVLGPIGDSFRSSTYLERTSALQDFPLPQSLAALQFWQVDYVLLTPSQIEDWDELRQAIESTDALRFERTLGEVEVYRVQR
jgi:hypothetical protein